MTQQICNTVTPSHDTRINEKERPLSNSQIRL